jgi:hypothetical protein
MTTSDMNLDTSDTTKSTRLYCQVLSFHGTFVNIYEHMMLPNRAGP